MNQNENRSQKNGFQFSVQLSAAAVEASDVMVVNKSTIGISKLLFSNAIMAGLNAIGNLLNVTMPHLLMHVARCTP